MTIDELKERLSAMLEGVENSIAVVSEAAAQAQSQVRQAILDAINRFEISDGRFVSDQNYAARILVLEREINRIIEQNFSPSLKQYFNEYRTVEQDNIALQKSYNDLEVETSKLTGARKALLSQAEYYLTEGLNDAYVQPAKYILMQQVTTGMRVDDATRQLIRWDKGELTNIGLASGQQSPNLQRYATQVARDSIHQFNGAINEVISQEYNLTSFIYVGGTVKDSRPFCRHLVSLRRIISLDEIPALVEQYPQGLYPNTSKKNFFQVRGGYNCMHTAFPTKSQR